MDTDGGWSPLSGSSQSQERANGSTGRNTGLDVISDVPPSAYVRWAKPVLDRFAGLVLLVVASPFILVAGVLILVKLGRPVFYSQERIGLNGNSFRLHKLRTMLPDRRVQRDSYHGADRRITHKSPNDPRVAPLGRALRSMRIDELPQFWNVVKGDMSLVGPRPELPEIVSRYEPWQHQRHAVKPGVTGPWQVSPRNGKLMHECTQIDLEYLGQMSLREDLLILARTPIAMLGNRRGF